MSQSDVRDILKMHDQISREPRRIAEVQRHGVDGGCCDGSVEGRWAILQDEAVGNCVRRGLPEIVDGGGAAEKNERDRRGN